MTKPLDDYSGQTAAGSTADAEVTEDRPPLTPRNAASGRAGRRKMWFCVLLPLPFLLTIAAALIVLQSHRAERQRAAVDRVAANGGEVLYDFQVRPVSYYHQIDLGGTSRIPLWLTKWVDIGFVHDVVHVRYPADPTRELSTDGLSQLGKVHTLLMGYSSANDADLLNLTALHNLSYCDLSGTQVTDRGLRSLSGLLSLRALYLESTRIGDAACEELEKMVRLNALNLHHTDVTDVGVKHLAGLKDLRWLALSETELTDEGLSNLSGITRLQTLALAGSRITDEGLRVVGQFAELQVLSLDNCDVSDAGVGHLQALTGLTRLTLNGTHVTDVGLEHLKGMQSLYSLGLSNTAVTEDGLRRLRKTLPTTLVYR